MTHSKSLPGAPGLSTPTVNGECVAGSSARRILVIVNPTAGSAKQAKLARALRRLERSDCLVTLRHTACAGDAVNLAREAALSGDFDVITAAGGDGTINEVANGLAQAPESPVALGILPLGTANVLAIEAGIPRSMTKAATIIARGLPRVLYLGEVRSPDHLDVPVRRFVMMAGTGFDAHVVETLDPAFKRRAGKFAYVWSAIRRAFSYPFPICALDVETIDGRVESLSSATVVVCNGRHYGGAFVAAPKADISVPTFQVLILTKPGIFNLMRYAWGLGAGRLPHFADVRIIEATRVCITSGQGDAFQVDGDAFGSNVSEIVIGDRPLSLIAPPFGVAATA